MNSLNNGLTLYFNSLLSHQLRSPKNSKNTVYKNIGLQVNHIQLSYPWILFDMFLLKDRNK